MSGLRSTWQVPGLGAGRMSAKPLGGTRPRGCLPGPQHAQGSRSLGHPPSRKGGSARSLWARLLSFRAAGWQPSTGARNRGTFMLPPPRAGSRALFSFHPVLPDSMGRNSAPCPTVATQTSILHRGSRDAPPRRGRGQGCYKELIVCWGHGSERGLGGGNRSQPEPCRAAGGTGSQVGAYRRGARGPGVARSQAPCLTAHQEDRHSGQNGSL